MSGYDVEHSIKQDSTESSQRPRRPDLSTFFSALEVVDTSGQRQPSNQHALPLPEDIAATFRTYAHALEVVRMDVAARCAQDDQDEASQLLDSMINALMHGAEEPPREVAGVSDSFLAELERIPKERLKSTDNCPICKNPFLDDQYALVVRLPCQRDHLFDLECISPWLKLNPTCPLDRKELVKKKPPPPPVDDDEGEWDDMYA